MTVTPTPLLDSHEVADVLHVHFRTVYELRKSGELPAVAVGGVWRFDPSDVQDYINRKKETPHA